MEAAPEPVPRTVTETLATEHRRLLAVVRRLRALVGSGDLGHAASTLAGVVRELRRHFHTEEHVFFPVLEEKAHLHGPAAVLRREHRLAERAFDLLPELMGAGCRAQATVVLDDMLTLLEEHQRKEEAVLCPRADSLLGPSQLFDVAAWFHSGAPED